jgi:hypothetical protein
MRRHSTYLFGKIVENVGLENHFHEDGTYNPAQLALPHVQHALHPPRLLPAEFIVAPCFFSDALDVAFEQGETHEVEVGILGCVFALRGLGEFECAEGMIR